MPFGLLWSHALDGEERPVWEARPEKPGWQLQHVHGARDHPLTSQSGSQAHRFWPLQRVHAYNAFSLRPGMCETNFLLQRIALSRTYTFRMKQMPLTKSDSDASPTDTGVHCDFSSRSSARCIQFSGHLEGIKQEDGAPRWKQVFLPVMQRIDRYAI